MEVPPWAHGVSARCPELSSQSDGLPFGPHGHCISVTSSSSWSPCGRPSGLSLRSLPLLSHILHVARFSPGLQVPVRLRWLGCCVCSCLLSSVFFESSGAASMLLEHLTHFVGVAHDVGPVLIGDPRQVLVHYTYQAVSLLPHMVVRRVSWLRSSPVWCPCSLSIVGFYFSGNPFSLPLLAHREGAGIVSSGPGASRLPFAVLLGLVSVAARAAIVWCRCFTVSLFLPQSRTLSCRSPPSPRAGRSQSKFLQ